MEKEIFNILKNFNPKKISFHIKQHHKDLYDMIIKNTQFLSEYCRFTERIYCVIKNITEIPKCPVCGNHVNFSGITKGYMKHCSIQCVNRNKEIKKKIKDTKRERYNNENYTNVKKQKQTLSTKTRKEWRNIAQKRKQTCFEKYGKENYINIKKIKKSKKERYGNENYNNREQAKKTCLKIYGFDNPSKTEEQKNRVSITKKSKSNKEKRKINLKREQTTLNKYGVVYNFLTNFKTGVSKISQELFWSIYYQLPKALQEKTYFAYLNFEFQKRSKELNCMYDFVISNIKFCIEFNGDYWHKNPKFHEATKENIEIWEKDKKKNALLESYGFDVIIIWENDYKNNKEKVVKQCVYNIKKKLLNITNKYNKINRLNTIEMV